jgi:hypothetical protein
MTLLVEVLARVWQDGGVGASGPEPTRVSNHFDFFSGDCLRLVRRRLRSRRVTGGALPRVSSRCASSPAEQARIVQVLVERVDVQEEALEVRIRAEGLASLVAELRQHDEERAA